MESTAFFEKKLSLTPSEFNKVKNSSIESILEQKAKDLVENKCSEQGFILPGSIKLLSRSMGYFEAARFTGDAVYYVKLEGRIIYPADGVRVIGEVIKKNKMGLYIDYLKAIRIQIPRDLHIGSEEYENVEIGDKVEVEIKRSKFQINDPYILASGVFIETKTNTLPGLIATTTTATTDTTTTDAEQDEEIADTDTEEKEIVPVSGGGDNDEDEDEDDDDDEDEDDEDEDEDEDD